MGSKSDNKSATKNSPMLEENNSVCYNERYTKICNIASGKLADIIKCSDRTSGKAVALKLFKKNEVCIEQLALKEIGMLKKISGTDNTFCLEFIESFVVNSYNCIVTEVYGNDLSIEIPKNRSILKSNHRVITKQLVQGLSFLHNFGIVHADIKTTNIVLKQPLVINQDCSIKIIDLGNAEYENSINNPCTDRKFVTINFRSPEIILKMNLDRSIDIWSLACVIYQIFHGKRLFRLKNRDISKLEIELLSKIKGLSPTNFDKYIEKSHNEFINSNTEFEENENVLSASLPVDNDESDLHSLLKEMLQIDPKERIKLHDALQHSYLSNKNV